MSNPTAPQPIPLQATLSALPPIYPGDLRAQTRALLAANASSIPLLVALDDDPTGTQTCHDIRVLTVWDVESLAAEFAATRAGSGFFILTNSRALHTADARALTAEICGNLRAAGERAGRAFEVVLRGDSTLRGHFPDEPEVVDAELGGSAAWVLAPFFLQGGRYTIDDVHYVAEGETLVPAGETPFARDATFGYRSSDLRDWVVEKSGGKIARERVVSLGLKDIREGGPERIAELLEGFEKGAVIVVNAAAEEDMDVVVLGLLKASSKGKRFLFRTAAAFVSARLGISPIPPISAQQLQLSREAGGLIIAGSYVPKTTAQLEALISKSGDKLKTVIMDVEKLLSSPESAAEVIAHAIAVAEKEIAQHQDVLVMTSRKLVTGDDAKKSLDIGSVVADALVKFLQQLKVKPRYVIAKGGITSSDMATKGLNMKKAMIVGQAAAGIPLWRCDEETCKYPGLPYVVFPGNVGGNETLYDVVAGWRVGGDVDVVPPAIPPTLPLTPSTMPIDLSIASLQHEIASCERQLQRLKQQLAEAEARSQHSSSTTDTELPGDAFHGDANHNTQFLGGALGGGLPDEWQAELWAVLEQPARNKERRRWPLELGEYRRYGRQLIVPQVGLQVSCGEGGILGPVVGVMGVLQALEAIKLIAAGIQKPQSLSSDTMMDIDGPSPNNFDKPQTAEAAANRPTNNKPSLLLFSAYSNPQFRSFGLRTRKLNCAACSAQATVTHDALISGSMDYVQFCGAVSPVDALAPEERISALDYDQARSGVYLYAGVSFDACHTGYGKHGLTIVSKTRQRW
ncbi:putative oxidoreductase ygbj protein [Neofusicoccum parvum]|uniref:Uncharacterized oxidoreductase ygbj protein n=1 Tax=Botryosphaeria parva (strain UCR-NP2) TaxID=1287680 RepID=R1GQ44_BOTPV|nr:putative uncharacterized oxidoreductase ygbj protein [Neofusicoccum parvum UCRNP2]GME37161.1 putative oxidoreductase ygbj protein [Neofusicoccum parvum]